MTTLTPKNSMKITINIAKLKKMMYLCTRNRMQTINIMKKTLLITAASLIGLHGSITAQTFREWQDPNVNQVNRLPMHTHFFAYETEEAALAGTPETSANYLSLNGLWKFNWVKDADQRPTDFFTPAYNDRAWGTMPIPGCWEMNGYGDPQYTNMGYTWRNQYENNPPYVPEADNHVGSYRRSITVPAGWKGQQVIAHFGAVGSNMYLWVNGKFVGYSEDSKLECEFDVTPYLKSGDNLFAMQIFRWCDGTYIEDQDFWRFSGFSRDCYLYARPKAAQLTDIRVVPDLDINYEIGSVSVRPTLKGGAKLDLKLLDATGQTVAERQNVSGPTDLRVDRPYLWSAETPYLYTLVANVKSGQKVIQTVPLKVGIRKVELSGSNLLVNGQVVLFKGADRHEMDPDGGYVCSRERMEQDIRIMKENNINAVRTSHYPDDNYWYDLCDRYGIYMVAEANIESHGMGYHEYTLAKNDLYARAHMERNQRNVQRNYNHPAIIFWSLGNEAGFGPNFTQAYHWIKQEDPSRACQYERAEKAPETDIYCPMYLGYEGCEAYCLSTKPQDQRPLIQCEYAHAMGNSEGGFKEYWDLIRKYPKYQGGFIWDFVDQSIRIRRNGKDIYAYGGDFNRFDYSDNNFLDNGLISPDRVPNPHMDEVRYYYQNIWATPLDLTNGTVKVYNENFFADLSYASLTWELLCDGRPVQTGTFDQLNAAPQQSQVVTLPYSTEGLEGELLLNIYFKQKQTQHLVQAGHVVAKAQLPLNELQLAPLAISTPTNANTTVMTPTVATNDAQWLIIEGEEFRIEFSKQNGYLSHYDVRGNNLLCEGGQLTPNFWRAGTDNDYGAGLQHRYAAWKNPEIKLQSLEHQTQGSQVVVMANYDMPGVQAKLCLTYTIGANGEILVSEKMTTTPDAKVSELYRFGMQLQMPQQLDYSTFYGRGPIENYSDRNHSTFLGIYTQTADEQAYPYIRPQETGTKSDMRWWRQTDRGGRGLVITSDVPFFASALHYSIESLDDGPEKDQRHFPEVEPVGYTNVLIDAYQLGLGCVNSWYSTAREEYHLPYQDYQFNFKLEPKW